MHFCSSSCNCCVLFTSFPCIQQQGEEGAKVGTIKATIFAEPDLPQLTEPLEGYLVSFVVAFLVVFVWERMIVYAQLVGDCLHALLMKWHYLWNMTTPQIRLAFDCLFAHTIAVHFQVQLMRPGTGQNVSCTVGDWLPACLLMASLPYLNLKELWSLSYIVLTVL